MLPSLGATAHLGSQLLNFNLLYFIILYLHHQQSMDELPLTPGSTATATTYSVVEHRLPTIDEHPISFKIKLIL